MPCFPALDQRHPRVQTGNYSFDPLPDMPADFGPRVPPEGVEGLLVVCCRSQEKAPWAHFAICMCPLWSEQAETFARSWR